MKAKPAIRILHHLSRTGGTLISRCIATMPTVALLSEVHPDSNHLMTRSNRYEPLFQAHQWYGLVSSEEAMRHPKFEDGIKLIAERAREKGLKLVLRNWSHLDFLPSFLEPTFTNRIAEVLAPHFELIQTATVRHPVDQWISYLRLTQLLGQNKASLPEFLSAYLRFAELAKSIGFIRFEDFTANPDQSLITLCQRLDIPYSPDYKGKWPAYKNITGDILAEEAPRTKIERQENWNASDSIKNAFLTNSDYLKAVKILGYT